MENIDIWEHYDDLNRFLNAHNVLAASASDYFSTNPFALNNMASQ